MFFVRRHVISSHIYNIYIYIYTIYIYIHIYIIVYIYTIKYMIIFSCNYISLRFDEVFHIPRTQTQMPFLFASECLHFNFETVLMLSLAFKLSLFPGQFRLLDAEAVYWRLYNNLYIGSQVPQCHSCRCWCCSPWPSEYTTTHFSTSDKQQRQLAKASQYRQWWIDIATA